MGEHDGTDVVLALAQVRKVRNQKIDSEMLVARKGETGIDDDESLVALDHRHVLPDLAEAAEGNDAGYSGRHPGILRAGAARPNLVKRNTR